MNWPGVLDEGGISTQRMQVSDLYATLESAAGLRRRAPDQSFDAWRSIVRGKTVPREPMFFMNTTAEQAESNVRSRALFAGEWKLVIENAEGIGGGTTEELFHLTTDPGEQNNVASDNPGLLFFLQWLLEFNEARWTAQWSD